MTGEQWAKVWEILNAAENLGEDERLAYLSAQVADAEVSAKVAALLEDRSESDEPAPNPGKPEPGDRIGRYLIEGPIGSGSYGEIFSGQDTELQRPVALKFIAPQKLDNGAAQRLLREARAASSLNHPNIVVVHEVITWGAWPVIVMELVSGSSLRAMCGQKLSQDLGLGIGAQVLQALAFAHRNGVVHLDLKPENIMLRPDGIVKVLDFGLARSSPRVSSGSTTGGISVGTLRYMAPEQYTGAPASPASDIFSTGIILYEMLAGVHPFESGSSIETAHAIVTKQPKPLRQIEPGIASPAAALIERMLNKEAGLRPSAAEAQAILEQVAGSSGAPQSLTFAKRWKLALIPAVAAALGAAGYFGFSKDLITPQRMIDTRLDLGEGMRLDDRGFALSPDGQTLLFHANQSVRPANGGPPELRPNARLWILRVGSGPPREWNGVEGDYPFWSPDGKEVGYFAHGKLWRKRFPDGPAREICDAGYPVMASWGANGVILFAAPGAPVSKVNQDGGTPVPILQLEPGMDHTSPSFLPDGRHFLFLERGNGRGGRLLVGSVDGSDPPREIGNATSSAIFVRRPNSSLGALVYCAKSGMVMQPFDSASNTTAGEAKFLAPRTRPFKGMLTTAAASAAGDLVYRETEDKRIQVKIFDRTGRLLERFAEPKEYHEVLPSPDFTRVALTSHEFDGDKNVFEVFDRRKQKSFIYAGPVPSTPVWSPDGSKLMGGRRLERDWGFHIVPFPFDGTAMPRSAGQPYYVWPSDWSADGRNIVFTVAHPRTGFDIWTMPADGVDKPKPLINTPAKEQGGKLSADGKLLAFTSNESGHSEIYVTPFPPDGRRWKVSADGGQEAHWRRDGKELFYISLDYGLMAISVGGTSRVPAFGPPKLLFGGNYSEPTVVVWHAEPSADGKQFMVLTGSINPLIAPLRLRQNWWAATE